MKYRPRTIDVLSILYTIGYFGLFTLSFFREFPIGNEKVLTVLLGMLSAAQLRIIDSFFTKDVSNSSTAATIRAMKGTSTEEESK